VKRFPAQLDSRVVHDGRIVHLSIDTVRFPDGSTGELEMVRHSGAAAILPVRHDGGGEPRVVLVRQYRYAAGGEILEVPAGRPDEEGEPWERCARRELQEETGLQARTVTRLGSILTTPGFTDEEIHIFMATELTEGAVAHDRDEFLEPVEMSLADAVARIRTGEIRDAKTICALTLADAALRG
jgi:ADP-ribose pyrophosphatase